MDVKEKLVEIMEDLGCNNEYCKDCEFCNDIDGCVHRQKEIIADRLIANGVTVQELDGCKYCKEYEDLPEHFIDGKPVGRVFDTCIQTDENGLWHIEVPCGADIGIRFCPMCGRELPKPPKGE